MSAPRARTVGAELRGPRERRRRGSGGAKPPGLKVQVWAFVCAALILSVERLCYAWVWRNSARFRCLCAAYPVLGTRNPVAVLPLLFYAFEVIQIGVFLAWCYVHGDGLVPTAFRWSIPAAVGLTTIVGGQLLGASVFYRLGIVGVFYGNRFGYPVPWCRAFPFTMFEHPQYVGVLLSIWGFFLFARFPNADWCALPTLETVYYLVGARLER
jgi:phosphatidyl-N-methylethanolamine N-methyltransferase